MCYILSSRCSEGLHFSAFIFILFLAHPRFYNQIFSGIDPAGLAGQFLTATVNTSMYTFEMGTIMTMIEADILQKMREMIGWTDGDGIFSPGYY